MQRGIRGGQAAVVFIPPHAARRGAGLVAGEVASDARQRVRRGQPRHARADHAHTRRVAHRSALPHAGARSSGARRWAAVWQGGSPHHHIPAPRRPGPGLPAYMNLLSITLLLPTNRPTGRSITKYTTRRWLSSNGGGGADRGRPRASARTHAG